MDLIVRDKISKILRDGEKILFESEIEVKDLFMFNACSFAAILYLIFPVFLYLKSETVIQYIGATCLSIVCILLVVDHFFIKTAQKMVLTNQRILICNALFKKVESIELAEIFYYKAIVHRGIPSLKISTEKKDFTFSFLDIEKFSEEFKKACPDFVSRGERKIGLLKNIFLWTICVVFGLTMILYVKEDISLDAMHRQEFYSVMKNPEYRNYMEDIYKNIEDVLFAQEPPINIVISFRLDKNGKVLEQKYSPMSSVNNNVFHAVYEILSFEPAPEVAQKLKPYIVQIKVKTEGEKVTMSMETKYSGRHSRFVPLMSSSYGK